MMSRSSPWTFSRFLTKNAVQTVPGEQCRVGALAPARHVEHLLDRVAWASLNATTPMLRAGRCSAWREDALGDGVGLDRVVARAAAPVLAVDAR